MSTPSTSSPHFRSAALGPRLRKETGVPFTVIAHGTGEILLPSRVPLARQALKQRARIAPTSSSP